MKTMIVYGTKHGTAAKCAYILQQKLSGEVEVFNIKHDNIPDINKYDKVIIGGSIYAGTIQKEIKGFCNKNLSLLKTKKLGLYICCMEKNHVEEQFKSSFDKELLNASVVNECFGGEMIFSEMNVFENTISNIVNKMAAKKGPDSPPVDLKKELSMILDENIDKFALAINNA